MEPYTVIGERFDCSTETVRVKDLVTACITATNFSNEHDMDYVMVFDPNGAPILRFIDGEAVK